MLSTTPNSLPKIKFHEFRIQLQQQLHFAVSLCLRSTIAKNSEEEFQQLIKSFSNNNNKNKQTNPSSSSNTFSIKQDGSDCRLLLKILLANYSNVASLKASSFTEDHIRNTKILLNLDAHQQPTPWEDFDTLVLASFKLLGLLVGAANDVVP